MKLKRPSWKIVLGGFGLFIFLLVLRFPYQNLRGKLFEFIYKNTRIHINSEDMGLSLLGWPGIKLTNVDVTIPIMDSDIDIHTDKVYFQVGLGGIFPPIPSVSLKIKALKEGGNIKTSFSQSGAVIYAYVNVDDVELSQIKFSALSAPINGILDMVTKVTIDSNDLAKSTGYIEYTGKNLKTPAFLVPMSADYGFTIPSLTIGTAKGNIPIKNGVVEFQTVQFGMPGSDMEGSLGGEIKLGQTWLNSFVNLKLKIKLSDACKNNPQSATLVSFLNPFKMERSDGYGIKCSASVQDITTRFACAIPEKLQE